MFEGKTVIVLGAGASAPFGFPLGGAVYEKLIDGIAAVKQELDKESIFAPKIPSNFRDNQYFKKNPVRAFASQITNPQYGHLLKDHIDQSQILNHMVQFHEALCTSSAETIDRFLWENEHYLFIGKAMLSLLIFLEMYEWQDSRLRLRLFSERRLGKRRNWYHGLINRIRQDAKDSKALEDQEISVVTFNYDQSLERALETELVNTKRHMGIDYRDVVDVFHVNGTIDSLPEVASDPIELVMKCADELYLIDETPGSVVSQTRFAAKSALESAEKVYILGFHFDYSNVAAIGLNSIGDGRKVHCLNFDGHMGLQDRMLALGIPIENILSPTSDEPVHIDYAINQGFLER